MRGTLLSDEATEISFKRKIREAQLALEMEKVYSKDDILMMYLNTINYGDGCYLSLIHISTCRTAPAIRAGSTL